ncbi:MAG: hypothetical protein ACOYBY_09545 [Dermatophilaceae bacterium]
MRQVRCFPDERRVIAGQREVTLTAMELDLLAHLMAAPERVYSRAQLRAKPAPYDIIRSVRGVGCAASAREGG